MNQILSRRHPLKFYGLLLFVIIFTLGLVTAMLFVGERPTYATACVFVALGAWFIFKMYRHTPVIRIDENFISFNGDVYTISEIRKIRYTGRYKVKWIWLSPDTYMEAASIQFHNGEKKLIIDDFYANAAQLKQYLKHVEKRQVPAISVQSSVFALKSKEWQTEQFQIFNTLQWLSFRGIILWFFIVFLGCAMAVVGQPGIAYWAFSMLLIVCVIGLGWPMYYFGISLSYFQVRHNLFFWTRKTFHLSDIQEIVFESNYKAPHFLRIIFKDHSSVRFPAATLYDRHWQSLKLSLRARKIKVRDQLGNG